MYIYADRFLCYNNIRDRGEFMAVSKAQQKAVNKYMKENYDRINLTVPRGNKDVIKAHAEGLGESVNGYINRLIAADMAKHKN